MTRHSVTARHVRPRPYTRCVDFRSKLTRTLRAVEPILRADGVIVAGSEVPNLLQTGAASTLVVSQDVDIAIDVTHHAEVKALLPKITALTPSPEEPSVWVPKTDDLIEVNFIGMDSTVRPGETYVFEDDRLPLLVFAHLRFLHPARPIDVDGLRVPVARTAGLLLEKLVTDRSGVKGDRDLLVVLGLLLTATPSDIEEMIREFAALAPDERYHVRSNVTLLSLIEPQPGMPDVREHRARVHELLQRLDAGEASS